MSSSKSTALESLRNGAAPSLRTISDTLLSLIAKHDPYTGVHSAHVAHYATLIARTLGMDSSAIELVLHSAVVHDVGKMGIPQGLLTKAGRLSQDEFALIQRHPMLGSSIVASIPGAEQLVPIVLHHHERWDGRGYPTGLSGIEIPIESRIILVADAFDAMTTERPYGQVQTTTEALDEIERCSGQQFDPLIADAMLASSDRLKDPFPSR
jgi:HD-GYP domain-containing protein (c-di-GMP phosphodiesterase class II)